MSVQEEIKNIIPECCEICKSFDIIQNEEDYSICNDCGLVQSYQPFNYSYKDMEQRTMPMKYDRNKYLEKIFYKYKIPHKYWDYVKANFRNMNVQYDDIKTQKNFFSYIYFVYRLLKSAGHKMKYPKKITKKYKQKYEELYLNIIVINSYLK